MNTLKTFLLITLAALLTTGCVVRDLLPVPGGISQIHLTGNHWSPNSPAMKAMGARFGKESPYTITVQRITNPVSGQVVFDRAQTPRSLVDSVYADVPPGNYRVEYTCVLSGYKGARILNLDTQPVMVTTREKKRYNVGIYAVSGDRYVNFGGDINVPAGLCALSFVERSL